VGYPKSHPSDLDLAPITHFVNKRGQTTIFRPATPPATLVTLHVLSASAPPTTTQDISLADRTADGRPQPLPANPELKWPETFPVFLCLKEIPNCCGRPKRLANNWQLR
jgi:hypothetical protein